MPEAAQTDGQVMLVGAAAVGPASALEPGLRGMDVIVIEKGARGVASPREGYAYAHGGAYVARRGSPAHR